MSEYTASTSRLEPVSAQISPIHAQPRTGQRWTFTQGLIAGQLSMVLVAVLFIRYVIFEDAATALEKERIMRLKQSDRRRKRHLATSARRQRTSSGPATSSTFEHILQKTGYDLSTQPPEPTEWLNVLLAQAVAGYREDVLAGGVGPHPPPERSSKSSGKRRNGDEADGEGDGDEERERTAKDLMEEILNRTTGKKMDFLDPIAVTEVDFGDQYPLFSNARIRPADDSGRLRVEVDVDYSDQITMAVDTKLVINFPKPRFAVLPISLSLTIVRFSGTLAVELFSSEASSVLPTESKPAAGAPRSRHQLHFSLHPDFALDVHASSLIGSRAKLQDVPKIEQLLVSRVRGWVLDRFVWPRFWSLSLPNLVPSPAAAAKDEEEAARLASEAGGAGATMGVHADTNDLGPDGVVGEGEEDPEMRLSSGIEQRANGLMPGSSRERMVQEQVARQMAARAAGALGGEGSLFENESLFGGRPGVGGGRVPGGAAGAGGAASRLARGPELSTGGGGAPGVEAWRNQAAGIVPSSNASVGMRTGLAGSAVQPQVNSATSDVRQRNVAPGHGRRGSDYGYAQ